ncbi:CPBP family intramembrane metalloprotease [Flavihumibacter rivuli]|uniref:CPBP family intramembrane glutamic endopeptidase n=1 Tax=Flavihumibacter rivuli TaxID=2838156 RepID=UPI001BDF22DA|nr:CPBP family intramembrane glutamic endopeptidase [Flavihumibacter rivuli]ULQ57119.1 CPBP family intramembrane metalloprotease [Flavihumibacter rivuli]
MTKMKQPDTQYSLTKILAVWALSAIPMGILAFIITPLVASATNWPPLIVYWIATLIGLVWQFALSLVILKKEGHPLNWSTMAKRGKYQKPISPKTGKPNNWLLLWTIPFIILSALIQSGKINLPPVDSLLTPFIRNLPQYDLSSLATQEFKGAWWILALFILTSLFNYLLGEEYIYRGILLPKMNGVFGKWDWFFNGILFGLYHLHKPQIILSTALYFGFVFAFPSRLFQSSWMAVIIHGLEGVLGIILILGIILGLS